MELEVDFYRYNWERWELRTAGAFHTYYYGYLAVDYSPRYAWLLSYPDWVLSWPISFRSASHRWLD